MSLRQYACMPMWFKFASNPQMGDALYTTMTSSNGDEGRTHFRTSEDPKDQVSSAFEQNQKQKLIDSWNETRQIPTGSWQSKTAVTLEDIKKLSPVPIHDMVDANDTGGGFYAHHPDDRSLNYIGLSPDKPDVNILAHEIGHALTNEHVLGRMLLSNTTHHLFNKAPYIGAATGAIMRSSGTGRALQSLVLALGLAAPVLLSEGIASYKGYKLLQQAGASDDELNQYVKTLAGPQSTYLMRPAATALLTHFSKLSGAKLDGRTVFQGLDISIETDKGNYRYWQNAHDGTSGKTLMKYPYGYIRGTEGMDGDHVDCFIGPNKDSKIVYVITTNKAPAFKTIDEEKCMLGFDSAEEAKQAFLVHYTDSRFFNRMRAMSFDIFKAKALKTTDGGAKKIGYEIPANLIDNSPGSFNDQAPGDYLGFPGGSLVGLRKVEGDPLTPTDKINRAFRFTDTPMDTSTLDPAASAVPQSPGV